MREDYWILNKKRLHSEYFSFPAISQIFFVKNHLCLEYLWSKFDLLITICKFVISNSNFDQ